MTQQSEFVMHVEYCKSCSTHSWCTHHDQQKYQSIYIKLKKFINEEFPDIKIYGNRVPDQLVAIKPAQNKYFNTRTNKYVTFPIIGAFQITLNNQKLFSKKQDNCWPNFNQIKDQVYFKVNGKNRTVIQQPEADVDRDITTANNFSVNHSFLDSADKRTTFHKNKNNKNFTLTDHFKTYKVQNKENKSEIPTDNEKSQNMTSMNSLKNQIQFAQFKRNFQEYGLKNNNVPEFIKKKAFFRDEYGKKEMIVKLDSIQQESILFQQAQKAKRTSFKNSTKKTINPYNNLDSELDELQSKFKDFQQRVQHIRRKNKEFDSIPKINQNVMKQYKSLQKQKQKYHRNSKFSQNKFQKSFNNEQDEEDYLTNPIIFAKKRLNNIQEYINGTQQQKNQKLKKIYGEWKLLKKPTKYKKFKYVSPYRIQNQKTKHNKDIKVQDEDSSDQQLTTQTRNNNSKNKYKLQKLPPVNSKTKKEVKQNHFLSNRQNFNLKTKNKTQQDFFNSKFKGNNQTQLNSNDEEKVQNKFSRNYFRNSKAKVNTFQNKDLNSQFSSKQISDKENQGFATKNGFFQSQQNFTKNNQNHQSGVPHFKRGRKFSKQKSGQFSKQNSNQFNSIEKQKTFNTHQNSVHSANTKIKMPSVHKQKNNIKQNGLQKGINNYIQSKKTSNHEGRLSKINKQKRDELKKKHLRNSRQQQESNQSSQQNQRGWSIESDQKQQFSQQQIYNRKASPRQQSLNTQKTKKIKNAKEMLLDIKQQKDKEIKTKRKYKSNGSQNSVQQDQNSNQIDKKHYKNDKILSSESEQQIGQLSKQQYQKQKEKKSLIYSTNKKNIDTVNKNATKQKISSSQKKQKTKRSKKQDQKKLARSKVSQQQESLSEEEKNNLKSAQKDISSSNGRKNKNSKEVKRNKKQNQVKNSQIQNSLHTSQEQESCDKLKLKGKNHSVIQDSDDVNKKDQIIKIIKSNSYHSDAKSHNQNIQEKCQAKKSNKKKKSNQKNKKSQKKIDLANESEEDEQKIANKNNQKVDSSTKNYKINDKNMSKNQSKSSKRNQKQKNHNKQEQQQQSSNGSDKFQSQIQDQDKVSNKKRQLESINNSSYLSQLSNSNSKVFDNNRNSHNKVSAKDNKSKLPQQKDRKINSSSLGDSDNQDNQLKDQDQTQELKQKNKEGILYKSKSKNKQKMSRSSNFNKNDSVIQHQNQHGLDQSQLEQSGVTSQGNKNNSLSINKSKNQSFYKSQTKTEKLQKSPKITKVQNQFIDQANQKSIFHQIKHNKEWKQAQKQLKNKKSKTKKTKINQIDNKQQQDQLQNDSQIKSIGSADQKSNSDVESQQQSEQVQMSSQQLQTQTENEIQNEQNQEIKNYQDLVSSGQAQVRIKTSKKKKDTDTDIVSKNNEKQNLNKSGKAIIQSRKCQNNDEDKDVAKQRHINKSEKDQSEVQQKNIEESSVSEKEIQPKNMNESDVSQCQDQNQVNSQTQIKESCSKENSNGNESQGQIFDEQIKTKINQKMNTSKTIIEINEDGNLKSQTKINQKELKQNKNLIDSNNNQYMNDQIPVLSKESETHQQINQNNQIYDKEILDNKGQENKVDKINLKKNNECMIKSSKTINNSKRSEAKTKRQIKVFADKDSQDEPQEQQQKQQLREQPQKTSLEQSHQNQKSQQNQPTENKKSLKNRQEKAKTISNKSQNNKNNKIKQSSQQARQSQDDNSKLLEQQQEVKDNVYAEAKQKNKQKKQNNHQHANIQMIDFGVQMDALVNQSMQTSNIYLEKQSSNLYLPVIKPHETSQSAFKQSNEKIKSFNYPVQTSSTFGNEKSKTSQILNEQNLKEKLKTNTLKEDQILDNSYIIQDKKQQLNRNMTNRSKLKESLQNVRSSRIQNTQSARNSQQKSTFLSNSHQDFKNTKTLTSNISSRAHIIRQLYGQNVQQQIKKFPNFMKLSNEKKAQFHKSEQVSINKKISISKIFGQNFVLFDQRSIQPEYMEFNCLIPQLFKLIKILTNINEFLIVRLFQNPKLINQNQYGVWLCVESEWRCVIVNDQIQVNQKTNKPIYHYHSNNQIWPMILQKALAKTLEGYNNLIQTPCHKLFTMLTGSNSLFFNIKQDPTKNSKILKYISDCENKNFVIHAEKICKNLQEYQRKQKQVRVYYVLSEKKVNENQSLIEVRQDNKNSFWVKLSKFVQEFKSIQILQLRINHNFCQINLPKSTSTNHLTIVQLDFFQQSFGSITITAPTPTALKTYLYKEEKSNILKLVGEAKQKNKINLFFDCYFSDAKYYVFVQTKLECKIAYFGENKPFMKVIEEINSQGLKNDYTEYLPIKSVNKQNKKKMPKTINKAKFGDTGMSFKSQQDKISRLRQNFVQYLLKSRQNQQ